MQENREAYFAWKHAWTSRGKTLEDAIEAARRLGGDDYAETLRCIIERMEAPAKLLD